MSSHSPNNQALQLLKDSFGYDQFKPGQEEVIGHLLRGNSAAAVFPTGGGKSLCYQLPALALDGLTVVVSPLIALMKDQVDALTQLGIGAVRLDSSLDEVAYRGAMDGIRNGRIRLLYVSPERFNNERFRQFIQNQHIALFAVDEAHCISEWGHNFRPDYLKLAEFSKKVGAERVFALTATATAPVLKEICDLFEIDPSCSVRTGFYRPNLSIHVKHPTMMERDESLVDELNAHPPGPTIIYVSIQKTAERVAQMLRESGREARHYHAGMKSEDRLATQEWFLPSKDGVVVATIAFGMGIDKSDIRYVHHYNLSKSFESYSQEIGRAGRDGLPSRCVTFYCQEDLTTLENFAYGDTPSLSSVGSFLEEVFSQDDRLELALHSLSSAHDIRILVLRTILVYLELDGYLEGGTPIYSSYRFIPLFSSREIMEQYEPEKRPFLAEVFKQSKKGRKWFTLDAASAAAKLGVERATIVRLLNELSEKGLFNLEASAVRHCFQVLRRPENVASVARAFHQKLLHREERDVDRLHSMVDLLQSRNCLVNTLANYFTEEREEACGHCSACLGEEVGEPPFDDQEVEVVLPELSSIVACAPEVLNSPRALARFLCGLASPAIGRARLKNHDQYGCLEGRPFAQVLSEIESCSF